MKKAFSREGFCGMIFITIRAYEKDISLEVAGMAAGL